MTGRLLRRPRGAAEIAADTVRVLGALSVIVAFMTVGPRGAGVVALTLPGLLIPRLLGLRASADIVVTITLLAAGWTNAVGLYDVLAWSDLVVHFACTGVLAAVGYLLLAQLTIVPDPDAPEFMPRAGIVLTTTVGLTLSAVWEMFEWLARFVVEVELTYDDTITDIIAGGAGSLVAGLVLSRFPLRSSDTTRQIAPRT